MPAPVNAGAHGNAPVEHCLSLNQGVKRRTVPSHPFGLIRNAPGPIILPQGGKQVAEASSWPSRRLTYPS